MPINYENYYKDHYKSKFTEEDIIEWIKWFNVQWKAINKKMDIKKSASVLEIGTGFGGLYRLLQEKNVKDYTGLDLDPAIVDFSNKFFNTDSFKHQSIEELDTTKKYDYVFAFEVLEHIENPTEVINKAHKLLKKGGYFCGTTPYPFKRNILSDETHISVLHPKNWFRLFTLAKFSKVDVYPMSFVPFLWRLGSWANIRIPVFLPIKQFISTSLIIAKK